MHVRSPRHPCGCRGIGECYHDNGPTVAEDNRALSRLVNLFTHQMREKMHEKTNTRGGWDDPSWTIDDIKKALVAHIEKGDPVDVANFCAFWWNRLEAVE